MYIKNYVPFFIKHGIIEKLLNKTLKALCCQKCNSLKNCVIRKSALGSEGKNS